MNFRALKPFSSPKPGVTKPAGSAQLQPKDEMEIVVGQTYDLSHLSDEAVEFLTAEGCIAPADTDNDSNGGN